MFIFHTTCSSRKISWSICQSKMFSQLIPYVLCLGAVISAYPPYIDPFDTNWSTEGSSETGSSMSATQDWVAVICHGSWHPPIFYEPLRTMLQKIGVNSYCPLLPTCNVTNVNVEDQSSPALNAGPPSSGWPTAQGDADVIVELLRSLIEHEGRNVLLIGHSYGGWVSSQSALPELQWQSRQTQEKSGGIIGVLGYSAYLIPIGMSMGDFIQEPVPPWSRLYVSWDKPHFRLGSTMRI